MPNNKKKNKNNKKIPKEKQPETQPPIAETPGVGLESGVTQVGQKGTLFIGKLTHTKLANTDLPDRYKKTELKVEALTAGSEPPDDSYRITTIPPYYSDPPDPDGETKFIILSGDKKRLFSCPSFLTCPVPKAKPNTVVIKESPTGGLGMFALRDMKYGELLFAERPLLVCPGNASTHSKSGTGWMDQYTREDLVKILCFEWEQQLEWAVNHMQPERKEAYMALANSHTEDGSGPLLGIQRTNGFGLDLNKLVGNESKRLAELMCILSGMGSSEGQQAAPNSHDLGMYSVIAKDGSRINHSCSPNVSYEFSLASFSIQFHAMRDLKAGEEIFYSYTDRYLPTAQRRKQLEPYGFTCACTACSRATPESDKVRASSSDKLKVLEKLYHMASKKDLHEGSQSVRESLLPNLLEFRRKLHEEGLGVMEGPYLRSTVLLQDVYTHLGMVNEEEMKSVVRDLMTWRMMGTGMLGNYLWQGNEIETVMAKATQVGATES